MFYSDKKERDEFYEHMKLGGKIGDEPEATDREKVLWSLGFLNCAFQLISTRLKKPYPLILTSIEQHANMICMTNIRKNVMNEYQKANRFMRHESSQHVFPGDKILHGMMLYAFSYNDDHMKRKIAKVDEDYLNYIMGAQYASEKVPTWKRSYTVQA